MGREVSLSETVFFTLLATPENVAAKRLVVGTSVKVVSEVGNSVVVKGCVNAVKSVVDLGVVVVLECLVAKVSVLTRAVAESRVLQIVDGDVVVRATPVGHVSVVAGATWVVDVGTVIAHVVRAQGDVVVNGVVNSVVRSDEVRVSKVHKNGVVARKKVVGTMVAKEAVRRVEARNWPCSVSRT